MGRDGGELYLGSSAQSQSSAGDEQEEGPAAQYFAGAHYSTQWSSSSHAGPHDLGRTRVSALATSSLSPSTSPSLYISLAPRLLSLPYHAQVH